MIAQNRTFGRPGTYALRASRTSCGSGSPIGPRIALRGDIRSARTLGAGLNTYGTIPAADGGGGAKGAPGGRGVPGGAGPPAPAGARSLAALVPEPPPGEVDLPTRPWVPRVPCHAVRERGPRRADRGSLRHPHAPSRVCGPLTPPYRRGGDHARGRPRVRGRGFSDDGVRERGRDGARRVQRGRSPPPERAAERPPCVSCGRTRGGHRARIARRAPTRAGLRGDHGGLAPLPEDGLSRLHRRGPVPPGIPGVLVLPREDGGADRGVRDVLPGVSGARGVYGPHAPEDELAERDDGPPAHPGVPDPGGERGAPSVPRDGPLRSLRRGPRDLRDHDDAGRIPTVERAIPDALGALLQGQARDPLGAAVRRVPPAPGPAGDARGLPGSVARGGGGEPPPHTTLHPCRRRRAPRPRPLTAPTAPRHGGGSAG